MQLDGQFWLPAAPDHKIAGWVTFSPTAGGSLTPLDSFEGTGDLDSPRPDLRNRMNDLDQSDPTQQTEYFDLGRDAAAMDTKLQGLDAINERLTQPERSLPSVKVHIARCARRRR